jgi:hypothetical protein
MKEAHIFLVLRNKIIGIDSVITLCMQIHKECNCNFTFILFDHGSFEAIKDDNVVLFDAINKIGKLVSLSDQSYGYGVISKIYKLFFLIRMIVKINYGKSYIMHSGGLHKNPLKFIVNFLPFKKIIFHERSPYNKPPPNNFYNTEIFFNRHHTEELFNKMKKLFSLPVLNAGVLIGYDKQWNYFKHINAKHTHNLVFEDSRNAGAWLNFIEKKSINYINEELDLNNLSHHKNKKIITVFIGRIHLDKSGKFIESFIQMMNGLAKSVGNKVPIFIKAHIFSDIEFVERCISKGIKGYNLDYILTKLHPSVLSRKAAMSLFISTGTVAYEISNLNIPIIQCLNGFNDEEIPEMSSKMSSYIFTKKTEDMATVINKLLGTDHNPVVYKKVQGKMLDCSFLN